MTLHECDHEFYDEEKCIMLNSLLSSTTVCTVNVMKFRSMCIFIVNLKIRGMFTRTEKER